MNTGIFGEGFPYSNFHDLNMDWIIKIAKDFLDQYTHIQEIIENGEQSLQELTTSGLEQLQEKADNLSGLLQDWYDTHSEDIANQLADALADLNEWYNTHSDDIAEQLTSAIADFNSAAEAKSQALLDSWPADYSELVTGYNNLKSALRASNVPKLNIYYVNGTNTGTGEIIYGTAIDLTSAHLFFPVGSKLLVHVESGYKLTIGEWNEIGQTYVNVQEYTSDAVHTIVGSIQIFNITNTSHTDITPSETTNVSVKSNDFEYYANRTVPEVYDWHIGKNDLVFSKEQINGKKYIKYDFTVNGTGTFAAQLALCDSSDNVLEYIGKMASASTENHYSGFAVIPNNFDHAVILGTEDATDILFKYLVFADDPLYFFDVENVYINGTNNGVGEIIPGAEAQLTSLYMYFPVGNRLWIHIEPGYKLTIGEWNEIGQTYVNAQEYTSDAIHTIIGKIQIFNIVKVPSSNISPSDSSNVNIKIESFEYGVQKYQLRYGNAYIEATGDSTDMSSVINTALLTGSCVLGEGEFHIASTINMPTGASLRGQGDNTIIVMDALLTIGIDTSDENTIKDLKIQGSLVSKPSEFGSQHAIDIEQTNPKHRIENITVVGVTGAGVNAVNTYDGEHQTVNICNCRFLYCGCGVNIGNRAEAYLVEGCGASRCYIGICCIGGNNRICNCHITRCTIAIDMTSPDTTNNNGHSVFVGVTANHNTDYLIKAENIIYGSIFSGCGLYNSPIVIKDCLGIQFYGCEFIEIDNSDATDNSSGIIISNSIIGQTTAGTVDGFTLNNCTTYDGTPFIG